MTEDNIFVFNGLSGVMNKAGVNQGGHALYVAPDTSGYEIIHSNLGLRNVSFPTGQ